MDNNILTDNSIKKPIDAYGGALVFLFAVLANLAVQVVAGVVVGIMIYADGSAILPAAVNLLFMLLIQAALAVVYFAFVRGRGLRLCLNRSDKKIKYPLTAFAPLLALFAVLAFLAPSVWFGELLRLIGYKSGASPEMKTAFDYALGIFVLCVAAPICEELIFRGCLLSGLRQRYGSTAAVWLSGLAFMLMHMNPDQTVYQFCLGVVCGYAAVYSGSVILPMAIHACSNLFAVLIDYTALNAVLNSLAELLSGIGWLAALVTVALAVIFTALIVFILRLIRRRSGILPSGSDKPITLSNMPLASKPVLNADGEPELASLKIVSERKRYEDKVIYVIAGGLCALMWVFVLISGILG